MRRTKIRITSPGSEGWRHRGVQILLIFLILLIIMSCSCGCIRLVQKSLSNDDGSGANGSSGTCKDGCDVVTTQTHKPRTTFNAGNAAGRDVSRPVTPTLVAETAPILEDAPDPVQHATRFNTSDDTSRLTRVPDFVKTYSLQAGAIGLIVNVTKGPLIIRFDIDPVHDCIEDPDSCRGNLAASANRPYCTVTVRDSGTRAIVAQDGYGREYSSDTSNHVITVYGSGQYHITLEGSYLDLTLSITTGASAFTTDATSIANAGTTTISPGEYEKMMRQRRGV